MKTKRNFILDSLIFLTFLVVSEPALTGLSIHEWLGITFLATIVLHLLFHWDWMVQVTLRFFRNFFHVSRLNYLIDLVLLVSFVMSSLSGLMISRSILPSFGIHFIQNPSWRFIHNVSANLLLFLVALHFAIHWKWILNQIKRLGTTFIKNDTAGSKLQPVRIVVEENELRYSKDK